MRHSPEKRALQPAEAGINERDDHYDTGKARVDEEMSIAFSGKMAWDK